MNFETIEAQSSDDIRGTDENEFFRRGGFEIIILESFECDFRPDPGDVADRDGGLNQ